jgi:hypothetical protein
VKREQPCLNKVVGVAGQQCFFLLQQRLRVLLLYSSVGTVVPQRLQSCLSGADDKRLSATHIT